MHKWLHNKACYKNRRNTMPMGKGTYGSKKGRPPKKGKMKKSKPKKKKGY